MVRFPIVLTWDDGKRVARSAVFLPDRKIRYLPSPIPSFFFFLVPYNWPYLNCVFNLIPVKVSPQL